MIPDWDPNKLLKRVTNFKLWKYYIYGLLTTQNKVWIYQWWCVEPTKSYTKTYLVIQELCMWDKTPMEECILTRNS